MTRKSKKNTRFFQQGLAALAIALIAACSIGSLVFGATVLAADPPKFYAPALNVPIPGLDFTKHPIILTTDGKAKITFLSAYIGAAYNYLLGVSVIAAAVMIVYGGFRYIVGSATGITEGKNIIRDAIIGLVLMFGSWTILATLNPDSLTQLKPLEVEYIQPTPIQVFEKYREGVPPEQYPSWSQNPPSTVPPPPQVSTPPGEQPPPSTGESKPTVKAGAIKYRPAQAVCSSIDDCKSRFCGDPKNVKPPDGLPALSELVGFTEIFPPRQEDQIKEKGIGFFQPSEFCSGSKGCATTKLFKTVTFGPGADQNNINRMIGSMVFRPEVRDGLVKAGEEAKKRGYFLLIGDGTRVFNQLMQVWCQRANSPEGLQGLAAPGSSPHLLGVAVDIAMFQLLEGGTRYRQVTVMGMCGQTNTTKQIGVDYMRTMEEIMASAGFVHLASEVHHYNFGGVYSSDCTTCEFPGKYWERESKECKK